MSRDQSSAPGQLAARVAQSARASNAAGALYGLAVGDALGTTLEFKALEAPGFPQLASGPHTTVSGGGPFHVAAGQVTDDTHMACALLGSVVDKQVLEVEDVAARYVAWRDVAFDIGGQTASALALVAEGVPAELAGRRVWQQRGRNAAGNGSLMRTAPLAVLLGSEDEVRRQASVADSAITHFDPRCQLACAAFNAAIATCVRGQGSTADVVLDAADAELAAAELYLLEACPDLGDAIARAREDLASDLAFARRIDPELYGPDMHVHETQGFVRVGFRLAFWELLHAPSFQAGLVDVVNRGGDADTNGAIAGALLGAFHGHAAIPDGWLEPVLNVVVVDPEHALNTTYHPRQFRDWLALVFDGGV